jgi:hypothetical protein
VSELRDHHRDLVAATSVIDEAPTISRLGSPAKLAGAITGEYRRQRFSGRHPLVAFVLAPVALVLTLWMLLPLSIVLAEPIGQLLFGADVGAVFGPDRPGTRALFRVWETLVVFGAPAFVAVLVCQWGMRAAVSRGWIVTGLVLLAVLASMYQVEIVFPDVPGGGRMTLGFGLTAALVRLLVPLAVAALVVRYLRPRWRDEVRGA